MRGDLLTNIVLYSAQPILAAGLNASLGDKDVFQLSATCATLPELVEHIRAIRPALLLLDLDPNMTLETLKAVQSAAGGAKLILWVDGVSTDFASQAIGVGIRGILRKTLSIDLHLKCFRKVQEGELWLEKALSDGMLSSRRFALTNRERQLMGLIAQGLKNKEIAYTLQITEGTVKVYVSRLFVKVGANDRLDLALLALRNMAASGSFDPSGRRSGDPTAVMPWFVPSFVSRAVEGRLQ
jgi:two-component system, NarL family, nitrate/nitrite response regulator NarL